MKKMLLAAALIGSASVFAQDVHRCASHTAIEHQESMNPGYKAQIEDVFQRAKQWSQENQDRQDEILTIPVVVHIVYNNAAQNLHDSVIHEQILSLNEDYGRSNADTVNMRSDFETIVGDTRIRFVLASVDPNGNATNGITRTNTSTASFGSLAMAFGDMSEVEKVKSTAQGGIDPWDQSKYMNIWVCNMSINFGGSETTALLGYATPPDGLSHWPAGSVDGLEDGVVIQYQCFGRNNPNPLEMPDQSGSGTNTIEVRGRTVTHEVGHYLGLRHIWGDGDCTAQDGVDDTPNATAQSDFDCDDTKNTCTDNIASLGDLPDMIENYMDYSAETCQNSFTNGQKGIMYGVLENERYDLVHNNPASVEEQVLFALDIFPNPSKGIFNLQSDLFNYDVKVMSIDGKVMMTGRNLKSLDLSSYENGVYFVNISDAKNNTRTFRLIKN